MVTVATVTYFFLNFFNILFNLCRTFILYSLRLACVCLTLLFLSFSQ